MKYCKNCGKYKSLEQFHKHKNSRDGRNTICKKCQHLLYNSKRLETRANIKELLINEAGGKCIKCGYNKCIAALDFHHRDPNEKDIGLSDLLCRYVNNLSCPEDNLNLMRRELSKCDLLCANCHREEHWNQKHCSRS